MTIKINELQYDGISYSLSTKSPVDPETHFISGNMFSFMPSFTKESFGRFANFWSNLENSFFSSRDNNTIRELAQTMPGVPTVGTKTTSFYELNNVRKPNGEIFSTSQTRTRDFFNIPLTLVVAFGALAIAYCPNRDGLTQEILQGSNVPVFLSELCKKVRNTHTTKVVVKVCGLEINFDSELTDYLAGTFLDVAYITSRQGILSYVSLCNRLAQNQGNYIKMVIISRDNLRTILPQLDGGHQNTYGALNAHKIIGSSGLSKIVELRPNNAFSTNISDVHFVDATIFGQAIWLGPDMVSQLPRVKENFHALIEFPTDTDCVTWIIRRVTGEILNGRTAATAEQAAPASQRRNGTERNQSDFTFSQLSRVLGPLNGGTVRQLAKLLLVITRILNQQGGTLATV